MPIKVLIAEDQPIVQLGLSKLMESDPGRFTLVGVANTYAELAEHPGLPECDVLLLDLHAHHAAYSDLMQRLISEFGIDIVVLAEEHDHRLIQTVVNGALGIVLKSRPLEDVLRAIEHVHAGEAWLERSLVASLIKHQAGPEPAPPRANDENARRIQLLTQKEREVIASLVEHRGAKSFIVAEALGISERTVRNRLTFIYDKLRLRGKLHLYVYALEHGLGPAPVTGAAPPEANGRRHSI